MKKTLTAALAACMLMSLLQLGADAKQKTNNKNKQPAQIELKTDASKNGSSKIKIDAPPAKIEEQTPQDDAAVKMQAAAADTKQSKAGKKQNSKKDKQKEIKKAEQIKPQNQEPQFMKEKVFYLKQCDNIKIAAEIYVPKDFDKEKEYPAIFVVSLTRCYGLSKHFKHSRVSLIKDMCYKLPISIHTQSKLCQVI